jgi:hypothetical protein
LGLLHNEESNSNGNFTNATSSESTKLEIVWFWLFPMARNGGGPRAITAIFWPCSVFLRVLCG